MESFTPYSALAGGALIGAAATLLLLLNGRVAGVSGVFFGLVAPLRGDVAWRAMFVLGLILGAVLYRGADTASAITIGASLPVLIAGVSGTIAILAPQPNFDQARFWLALIGFFDVVFLTLTLWTFEPLMSE